MEVFISFAQNDHHLVYLLCAALQGYGITPAVAVQRLAPGSRLDEKVAAMIRVADCVVVLITPSSQKSQWVQQEIGYAKARDKYIVPLKTRTTHLPALLSGLEYYQFVVSDPAEHFERLAAYLRRYAEEHSIEVNAAKDAVAADFQILHLPSALRCPRCRNVDVHVAVCLICGEWVCTECGATIPPTAVVISDIKRKKREA